VKHLKEEIKDNISWDVEKDVKYIKDLLKDNSDVVFRQFRIQKMNAAIIYIDGMSDKFLINDYVLESLMHEDEPIRDVHDIKDKILTVSDMREVEKLSEGINAMLSGETLMLIDGLGVAFIIATRSWPARGVGEPSGETVVRGAREGFTETVRFNTALIRRRIRDTRLRMVAKSIGVRSKTDVVITYIDDIVNKDVLDELTERINDIPNRCYIR
jgi:Bacillus/Clostridium GerA spore germination protein.